MAFPDIVVRENGAGAFDVTLSEGGSGPAAVSEQLVWGEALSGALGASWAGSETLTWSGTLTLDAPIDFGEAWEVTEAITADKNGRIVLFDEFLNWERRNYAPNAFPPPPVRNEPSAGLTIIPEAALLPNTGYYTDEIGGGFGTLIVTTDGGNAANVGDVTGRNDDGFRGPLPLGFTLDFYGGTYTQYYLNNNGSISFGDGVAAYTPAGPMGVNRPMISPFFADVDTRHANSGLVYYRQDIPDQLICTWDHTGYFDRNGEKTCSFQLVLRGPNYPVPPGEGFIGFFWKEMEWETGEASNGTNGFGGYPAAVGFGNGSNQGAILEFSREDGISRVVDWKQLWFNLEEGVPVVAPPPPDEPLFGETFSGPRVMRDDPLGAGLLRPFLFVSHGDLESDQGVPLVLSNVGQIMGTHIGTLPWRPEFGSNLQQYRHRSNNQGLRELATLDMTRTLSRWEPRVTLREMRVKSRDNQLDIEPVIAIEGASALHNLDLRRALAGGGLAAEPQAYELVGSQRVSAGMASMAEPYKPVPQRVPRILVGLAREFVRDHDLKTASGIDQVLQQVGQVLGTDPGTLPWEPGFGGALQPLRHQANNPALRELATLIIDRALRRWVPRARLVQLEMLRRREGGAENVVAVRAKLAIRLIGTGETERDVTLPV